MATADSTCVSERRFQGEIDGAVEVNRVGADEREEEEEEQRERRLTGADG